MAKVGKFLTIRFTVRIFSRYGKKSLVFRRKTFFKAKCTKRYDRLINKCSCLKGFTKAKRPWLPVNPNYYKINVESQKKIPTSNYNFYKKMSKLRRTDVLKYGDLQKYNVSDSIYIVKRYVDQTKRVVCRLNAEFSGARLIIRFYSDHFPGLERVWS